jgi:hypothetical protein
MPMCVCKCCYDVYGPKGATGSEYEADDLCQRCGDAWKRQGDEPKNVPASSIDDIRANIVTRYKKRPHE